MGVLGAGVELGAVNEGGKEERGKFMSEIDGVERIIVIRQERGRRGEERREEERLGQVGLDTSDKIGNGCRL